MASVEDIVSDVNTAGHIHSKSIQPMAAIVSRRFNTVAHAQGEGTLRTDAADAIHALFAGLRDAVEKAPIGTVAEKVNEAHDMYAQAINGSDQQTAQDCLAASSRTIEQVETVATHRKSLMEMISGAEQAALSVIHEGLGEIAAAASVAYVAAEDMGSVSVDTAHRGHEYIVSLTHR